MPVLLERRQPVLPPKESMDELIHFLRDQVDGIRYELSTHDCVDVERAGEVSVTGIGFSRLLVFRGRRR